MGKEKRKSGASKNKGQQLSGNNEAKGKKKKTRPIGQPEACRETFKDTVCQIKKARDKGRPGTMCHGCKAI